MLLMNKEKIQVDGVDVYPDHADPDQFWMVPGTVRLAARDGEKLLSYLWYIDGSDDSYGTGYLNFEVNTAIDDNTRARVRQALLRAHPDRDATKLRLSTVSYDSGKVNFSVLGPMAEQMAKETTDTAVVHRSKEQVVWNAGSSSLVGENAAVCSVRLSKEGRLAALMAKAIEAGSPMVAAVYSLEFTGLRPSVTFHVKGKLKEVRMGLNAQIGATIPLEEFILGIGTSVSLEKIMNDVGLEIEVVDYDGEAHEGLTWARQILMDYILDNFFKVKLHDKGWTSVDKAPEISSIMKRAKDVSKQAQDKAQEKGAGEGGGDTPDPDSGGGSKPDETAATDDDKAADDDKAGGDGKAGGDKADSNADKGTEEPPAASGDDPPKETGDDDAPGGGATGGGDTPKSEPAAVPDAVKQAVASAFPLPIPKVDIKIDMEYRVQENSIDFTYSETKAKTFTVAPQGLVLAGLRDPARHITRFNRGEDPFGLPHPVSVTAPDKESFAACGLKAINLSARYPAGSGRQQPLSAVITPDKFDGTNPLPFQFDHDGTRGVDFDAEFVFDAAADWKAATNSYRRTGTTEAGIDVQPAAFLGFRQVAVLPAADFVWQNLDQVVVTVTGEALAAPATVVFQHGDRAVQTLRFRTERKDPELSYRIDYRSGAHTVLTLGPSPVLGGAITVPDRFAGHVPVKFRSSLKTEDVALVVVTYRDPDNGYVWESEEIEVAKGAKDVPQLVIPTLHRYEAASDLTFTYSVETASGAYEDEGKGGRTVFIKDPPA